MPHMTPMPEPSPFYWMLGEGLGLLIIAGLVAHFAPARRQRLRFTLMLYILALLTWLGSVGSEFLGWQQWRHEIAQGCDLLQILVLINLLAAVFFDLVRLFSRLTLASIITDMVLGVSYFVAVLHAMNKGGVHVSGIVATSAVVSGVIGLSLAPTIGNVLGGVALQLDNSISEGDWIQLDPNTQGRVKEIRWRHTVVETRNWDTIIVPNATLLSANITILGKRSDKPRQRRYWVYFNVDFRHAPEEVIRVVTEALQFAPITKVAAEPPPHAICLDLARDGKDSFGYYAARYWLTDLAVDDPTSSLIRERIFTALQRAGMSLAIPASTVFVSQDDPAHKERKEARELGRRLDMLSGLELFRDLTPDELSQIAARLHHTPFACGEVMTLQGRKAHWLYILSRGSAEVRVRREVPDAPEGVIEKVVREIHAPDFFGEMGLMTGEPRLATVVATTQAECYRLDKEAFQKILEERKELVATISLVLARRRSELVAARDNLDAEQKKAHMAVERDRLFNQIERFFGLKG